MQIQVSKQENRQLESMQVLLKGLNKYCIQAYGFVWLRFPAVMRRPRRSSWRTPLQSTCASTPLLIRAPYHACRNIINMWLEVAFYVRSRTASSILAEVGFACAQDDLNDGISVEAPWMWIIKIIQILNIVAEGHQELKAFEEQNKRPSKRNVTPKTLKRCEQTLFANLLSLTFRASCNTNTQRTQVTHRQDTTYFWTYCDMVYVETALAPKAYVETALAPKAWVMRTCKGPHHRCSLEIWGQLQSPPPLASHRLGLLAALSTRTEMHAAGCTSFRMPFLICQRVHISLKQLIGRTCVNILAVNFFCAYSSGYAGKFDQANQNRMTYHSSMCRDISTVQRTIFESQREHLHYRLILK